MFMSDLLFVRKAFTATFSDIVLVFSKEQKPWSGLLAVNPTAHSSASLS